MDKKAKVAAMPETERAWAWPDSLDALVAAPGHHTLLMENERVRVLDTRILPGDMTPVHTHRWPCVYHVQSWGDFVRRDGEGNVLVDTRKGDRSTPPTALWGEALPPHSLENVGDTVIHVVSVELKDQPG